MCLRMDSSSCPCLPAVIPTKPSLLATSYPRARVLCGLSSALYFPESRGWSAAEMMQRNPSPASSEACGRAPCPVCGEEGRVPCLGTVQHLSLGLGGAAGTPRGSGGVPLCNQSSHPSMDPTLPGEGISCHLTAPVTRVFVFLANGRLLRCWAHHSLSILNLLGLPHPPARWVLSRKHGWVMKEPTFLHVFTTS